MPLPASLEGPHPFAHTRRARLRNQSFQINSNSSQGGFRKYGGVACSSRPTSHTLVPSLRVRAPYSSATSDPGYSSGVPSAASTPFAGQAEQRQPDSNAAPDNYQQERPGSPSGIVSLMQAWGQLSTRLQAPPATGSVASADTDDDAVTQLILSALKLAVRSLSRVPAVEAGDCSSSPAGTASSNKPAVQRSLALAAALAELYANGLPLDAASIAAGIVAEAVDVAALHIRTVQAKLGQEVAGLVQDVLAVRHAPDRLQVLDDPSSSALRGWLLTAYDVRACAIEVVWRCMALVQPPTQLYQQQLLAMEALTVYCPLGHALGLGVCSATLEDAAFKVLFPSSYASTARHVLPMSGAAAELLARCQATLQDAAAADAAFQQLAGGLQLLSRTKSLYSIMKKLLRLNDPAAGSRRLGEMYDLLGLRAVVLPRRDLPEQEAEAAAVQACYRLQELAQQQWPPVHGRSKDYIARPKPNGYQSLHSTLSMQHMQQQHCGSSSSSGGSVVLSYLELQVRTAAMHAAAEGGDAAHAGYKGRLEKRQVRHLQAWTAQLQRRLAAPQQQLLLTLPISSSGTGGSVLQPMQPVATFATSSEDGDTEISSCSSSSSSSAIDTAASAAAEQQHQQAEQQPAAAAAAAASLFRHLDLDGDGMLSLYELTELLSELGEFKQQAAAVSTTAWHSGLPATATAAATGKPFMPVSPPAAATAAAISPAAYAQQVFEMLDSNGDGLISMAEFLDFYLSNTTSSQTAADASRESRTGLAAYPGSSSSSSSNSSGSGSSTHLLGSTRSSSSMSLDQSPGAGHSGAGSSSSIRPMASASGGAVCQVFMHGSLPAAPKHAAEGVGAGSGNSSGMTHQYFRPPGVATPSSFTSSSGNNSSSSTIARSSSRRRSSCKCMANSQSSAAAAIAASDAAAYGTNSSSDSSSSESTNGPANQSINGSGNRMHSSSGNGAGTAATAAAVENDNKQQQQQQVFPPPTWRQTTSSTGAEPGQQVVAAAISFNAQQEEPEQLHIKQQRSSSSSQQQDSQEDATSQQQQRQQLEAELSYEEDEQQQRRFLRQQQRQLPSLLEDAAAGRSPCYVLVPVSVQRRSSSSSSTNGSSSSSDGEDGRVPDAPAAAAAQPVMTDWLGQQLHEIEVPCLGPLLITNAPQVFKSSDVQIDAPTEHYDRLAITLELVKPTGSSEPVLQARNISRVVRGRLDAAAVRVNYGLTVLQPHRAAVQLLHGDVIELGETGVGFVVQQVERQATSPAVLAVQQFLGVYAEQQLGLKLPVQQALDLLQQQQWHDAPLQPQQQHVSTAGVESPSSSRSSSSSSTQQGWNASAADAIESQLRQISRVVRSDARAAEVELCRLAAAHPDAPGPWFLLAQVAASSRRPWMARQLFRAAAVCQQQQLEQVMRGGAAAEAAAALPGQQQEQQADGTAGPAAAAEPPSISSNSSMSAPNRASNSSSSSRRRRRGEDSSNNRSPAFRLSSRLVQVLRVWARSEWEQRLFGPARRLWRLAANEAFKFPYDIAAEGGGAVLHAWATAEFERDNVLNARVVIGEALRKCPKDAAVAVLAGSIEASAGEYSAARALFLRAYQLNKADKQLYMQWPRMEGAVGNNERARLLFQYGLSLYPSNIKILNLYACFEEQQGNVQLAREMHQRALGIDNASLTSMHNRVSWAELELREGNVEEARELLREGLDAHPDFPAALLLSSKLERQEGQLDMAEAYARRAQKASHAFATAAMSELAAIYAARGESGLAANLKRHIANMNAMQGTKQAGKLHGSQAWMGFHTQNAQPEQRQVIQSAWQRKAELGLIRQRRVRGRDGRQQHQQHERRQQQQQQQHDWQPQQSRNGNLEMEVDSVVKSFDFAAAAAAAASAAEQQRQRWR